MKDIYLVGAGGHCRACIDVIEATGQYRIAGLFDSQVPAGEKVLGYTVLGGDDQFAKYVGKGEFLVTVGQIKTAEIRRKIHDQLIALGAKFATVVSPRAHVSRHAKVGAGTIIMHDVLVQAAAHVGAYCIVNDKALIEHDGFVGDLCHVATGAIVNGGSRVEAGSFIGSNAVLQQNCLVPANSVVGAGSFFKRSEA